MTISERIFQLLEERRMTQREFAGLTGISYSTISDWKHKNNTPAAEKIMVICHVLEVTPEYLLGEPDFTIKGLPKMDFSCASDSQELRLVNLYRELSGDGKQLLWSYLETLGRLNALKNGTDNTSKSDE